MSSAIKTLKLVPIFSRQISRTAANSEAVPARIVRLREAQKKFQIDDGLPVHLKGGIMDKLLYQFTFGCCFAALAGMGCLFWELAVPKKN